MKCPWCEHNEFEDQRMVTVAKIEDQAGGKDFLEEIKVQRCMLCRKLSYVHLSCDRIKEIEQ